MLKLVCNVPDLPYCLNHNEPDSIRANTAAPSVRVFFSATRRKMYREPVINRQKCHPFQQVLDTLHCVAYSNSRQRKPIPDKHYIPVSSSFFAAKRRKMYREPVNSRQKCHPFQQVFDTLHFVAHSNSRQRKPIPGKHYVPVSSSFFRSKAEKNVSRTGE